MLFIKLIAQKKIKTYSMTNKFVLLTFWQIAWINSCQVSILNFISYFVFTHIIIGMKPKKFHKKASTSRKEEKIYLNLNAISQDPKKTKDLMTDN